MGATEATTYTPPTRATSTHDGTGYTFHGAGHVVGTHRHGHDPRRRSSTPPARLGPREPVRRRLPGACRRSRRRTRRSRWRRCASGAPTRSARTWARDDRGRRRPAGAPADGDPRSSGRRSRRTCARCGRWATCTTARPPRACATSSWRRCSTSRWPRTCSTRSAASRGSTRRRPTRRRCRTPTARSRSRCCRSAPRRSTRSCAIERPARRGAPPQPDRYRTIAQFYEAISEAIDRDRHGHVWSRDLVATGAAERPVLLRRRRRDRRRGPRERAGGLELIVEEGEGFKGTIFDGDEQIMGEHEELAHYFRFEELARGRRFTRGDTAVDRADGRARARRLDEASRRCGRTRARATTRRAASCAR